MCVWFPWQSRSYQCWARELILGHRQGNHSPFLHLFAVTVSSYLCSRSKIAIFVISRYSFKLKLTEEFYQVACCLVLLFEHLHIIIISVEFFTGEKTFSMCLTLLFVFVTSVKRQEEEGSIWSWGLWSMHCFSCPTITCHVMLQHLFSFLMLEFCQTS